MDRQPTTRLQVSGYRFLVRRMEHALIRGDIRMLDDPPRAQSLSLWVGAVLAVIAVAGCAILAYLRPAGELGDHTIVVDRTSGALYVRVDDTWHPVLNLASARLIAGTAADPTPVGSDVFASAKLGPLMGIPGAPAALPARLTETASDWTVCDSPARTGVIVGPPPRGDRIGPLRTGHGVLVTARGGKAVAPYLLYDGRRSRIDLRETAVVRALRLEGVTPLPVSEALLATVPEAPAITAPTITQAGTPSRVGPSGTRVGTVVRLSRTGVDEFFVVLADGVQRVGRLAADIIRFGVPQPDGEIRTVSPDAISAAPMLDVLPVRTFPDEARLVDRPALCAHWAPGADGQVAVSVLVGDPSPVGGGADARVLAQADGAGPNIDTLAMRPGHGAYLRSTGLTAPDAPGSRFLLTESGAVFGVADDAAADRLGLSGPAAPAPWPLLALLPRGPELSVAGASVVRDVIAAPPR